MGKRSKTKTEHSGAKNGGGHWGSRADAKAISKKHRRENAKQEIRTAASKLTADEIAAKANRGEDVSRHFAGKGRMMQD